MAHTHPQAHVAQLAARLAALQPGTHEDWTVEQLVEALGEHALCLVRWDDGRWAVRVTAHPGAAQEGRTQWCVGATMREALQLAMQQLAADGGEA